MFLCRTTFSFNKETKDLRCKHKQLYENEELDFKYSSSTYLMPTFDTLYQKVLRFNTQPLSVVHRDLKCLKSVSAALFSAGAFSSRSGNGKKKLLKFAHLFSHFLLFYF